MKSGRLFATTVLIASAALVARAELAHWVQHQPAGPVLDALLRSMPLPGGPVRLHRPPSETRPTLTRMIGAEPTNAALFRLRAHEAELQLDFTSAAADWQAYANLAGDRGAAYLELADFHHRRVRAEDEIKALETVGRLPSDPFLPAAEQRSWQAYKRMLPVIEYAGLPAAHSVAVYRSWIARYPNEPSPRRDLINFQVGTKQFASAEAQIAEYAKAFPEDGVFPVEARASLASRRDSEEAALRVYDRAFQPLWPKALLTSYFTLLDRNSQLREFLANARAARDKNPVDLDAVSRLFAYFQHTNNIAAARRALLEYRIAKETKPGSWTASELKTLAGLFERIGDINEQARAEYALYSAPGATDADREAAISGLTALLLTKPNEPVRFGSGDLSLYKDIATADSSPGFLNGILSLVLNSTTPRYQYEQQNNAASAYFHRAEGAKLLDLLEKQFPTSPRRASLRASLVDAYASYGDDDAVIAEGRAFLTAFPRVPERTHIALTLADALARRHREREEFVVYQQMLTELAARAGGVPLGVHGGAPAVPENPTPQFFVRNLPSQEAVSETGGARSPDYVSVLDRYLARVSAAGQPTEALRIYRRELDRNPKDPGLYERFAGFLEQNNLSADVQDIYRRAIAKFPDRNWYHKLARWYLRGRQQSALTAISREATGIFSGTELEAYFRDVIEPGNVGASLYLRLNLYAHQRFPEDLVFVQNLLRAYSTEGSADSAAAETLLHDYWFYDPALKRQYFEQLSSRGQLLSQMAALRRDHPEIKNGQWQELTAANPAAAEFNAEAEAWLGHFEAAAPAMGSVADLYPGASEWNSRASSLYRSIAYYFPVDTPLAASLAQRAYDANPRDTKLLETVGDVYSDKGQFTRAALSWNAIPRVFPGKPDGYLETATVFWDYYKFDDALRSIRQARTRYKDDTLFAYEAGAIEEGRRDYPRAIEDYMAGAAAGNESARTRLIRLASRPAQRDLVYRLTTTADAALRIDVLRAQQRRPELEAFLTKEITVATLPSTISPLVAAAREQGFESVERQGLEREIAATLDPVERTRLRIEFVKYLEAHKDLAGATRSIGELYRDNPLILGVVRARVDFETRNKRPDEAIAVLTESAARSRADLSAQFRFEAARVGTQARRIDQARALLTELLKSDPYRADYLAQMADTYAAANDDAGFVSFAESEIVALGKAPMPSEDRKSRIAALRRRLVVTLAHRNDYAGALDQYIEVINQYPEDESVAREAALFARAHGRSDQLTAHYRKTVAASPRDWRWHMVLARVETALEDYPAALGAYDNAMKARPDRADLVQARVELEERLLHFDDAIQSYLRLYQLTYNDPQWLDKASRCQARLGRRADAIATLERAHIGAGGETVTALFEIARQLESSHLFPDAARFAERGFALAGKDIWRKYPSFGGEYLKLMAEIRRTDILLIQGSAERTNALPNAGTVIAEIYTPEEKAALAARIEATMATNNSGRILAEHAGLKEIEAKALYREWMAVNQESSPAWIALQSKRGLYEQLSRDLEIFADGPGRRLAAQALLQAAVASSEAGDAAAELRIYGKLQAAGLLAPQSADRYLSLLMEYDPKSLIALAGSTSAPLNDRAVQFAIGSGKPDQAKDAIRARAGSLPPVWLAAYTALAGVYFDERSPDVNRAFVTALRPDTIGQRLASRPDQSRSIVGSIWFYYGARYGEYLARSASNAAPDYLSSELEQRPGDPESYLTLAKFDAGVKLSANAVAEFRKALELDADRGEAHDGIARVLTAEGRRSEAVAEWREALAAFQREQSRGVRVRDTFWTHVGATFLAIGEAKALPDLQGDIHSLLADYIHRNGTYRAQELIDPALDASFQSSAGIDWMLDVLIQSNGLEISLAGLSADEQERLARFRLAYELREATLANGYERTRFEQEAIGTRVMLINLLLNRRKLAEAMVEWQQFRLSGIELVRPELAQIEIRLAAANATIDTLISRYRATAATAPQLAQLLSASVTLRRDGQVPAALAILEFAYTRELEAQHLEIANFLGLARVFLEREDSIASAVALLRRMTLISGAPFEGFEPAADLLLEFHHETEAGEFLTKALQALPWNSRAKLKLARISDPPTRSRFALAVIEDASALYSERADAARIIAPARTNLSGELALLASGDKSAQAARQPFYVESRWTAAVGASDPALKPALLREALAIAPEDQRVRISAVRAALGGGKDSLGLSLYSASSRPLNRYMGEIEQSAETVDRNLLEALAGAAERTWDLSAAISYLNRALRVEMAPVDYERIEQKRAALDAEQKRRNKNAKRQPVITNRLQQPQVVGVRNTK